MRYRTPAAFRAALEARLGGAQTESVGLSRLRKRVAFERLLARLQLADPGAWALKGGFALELRFGEGARTTKDMDLDFRVGEDEATVMLNRATALVLDDGFEFTIERSAAGDGLPGGGQRWVSTANLAGRRFEQFSVDIGFIEDPVLAPETIYSSDLLSFAGLAPLHIPAIAIEQHVAEKLHAYTRTYAGDAPSSRIKDLIDLAVIANTSVLDADRLAKAVQEIFERRATHSTPVRVPAPPGDWEPGWRALSNASERRSSRRYS